MYGNDPTQRQQKIEGVRGIAQKPKSYVNSMSHGKRIGIGYFSNRGKCITIHNPILDST